MVGTAIQTPGDRNVGIPEVTGQSTPCLPLAHGKKYRTKVLNGRRTHRCRQAEEPPPEQDTASIKPITPQPPAVPPRGQVHPTARSKRLPHASVKPLPSGHRSEVPHRTNLEYATFSVWNTRLSPFGNPPPRPLARGPPAPRRQLPPPERTPPGQVHPTASSERLAHASVKPLPSRRRSEVPHRTNLEYAIFSVWNTFLLRSETRPPAHLPAAHLHPPPAAPARPQAPGQVHPTASSERLPHAPVKLLPSRHRSEVLQENQFESSAWQALLPTEDPQPSPKTASPGPDQTSAHPAAGRRNYRKRRRLSTEGTK